MTRDTRRHPYGASLGAALCALFACSCASPHEHRVLTRGVDETLACPEGYVGYNFGESPVNPNSEYYFVSNDLADVPIFSAGGIQVESGQCYTKQTVFREWKSQVSYEPLPKDENQAIVSEAKDACDGESYCYPAYRKYCDFTYTCEYDRTQKKTTGGPDGGRWKGNVTGAKDLPHPALLCTGADDSALVSRRIQRRSGTACIPEYCHGKRRRDANLNCIEDEEMAAISLGSFAFTNSNLTPLYNPELAGEQRREIPTLYKNASYRVNLGFKYANGDPPRRGRMTYWISDVYVDASLVEDVSKPHQVAVQVPTVEAFRCTAMSVDLSQATRQEGSDYYELDYTAQLSHACFDAEERVLERLAAKTGVDKPLENYRYLGSRLNRSLDVIGQNVIVPGRAAEPDVATVCAPRPPEFFYDSASGTYDMVAYLAQRQVDSSIASRIPPNFGESQPERGDFGGHGDWVAIGGNAPTLRLGATDVRLGSASVEITNRVYGSTTMSADVTWFMAHDDPGHVFSPDARCVVEDGASELPCGPGSVRDMRANIYITPTDRGGGVGYLKIGQIDLDMERRSPTGSTETGEFVIPPAARGALFNATSPHFIPASEGKRSFEVVTCLEGRYPGTGLGKPFFGGTQNRNEVVTGGVEIREGERIEDVRFDPSRRKKYAVALGTGMKEPAPYTPFEGVVPTGGCAFSRVPLVIEATRLVWPVEPIAQLAFEGVTSSQYSGSSDMSAGQADDSEVTCSDDEERNCTEAMSTGMSGDGEMARTYYEIQTQLKRQPGSGVNLFSTAEVLGFQVLDMTDPMDDSGSAKWGDAMEGVTNVSITIAPNWDPIVSALRKSSGKGAEWKRGRYGGAMGIGAGIGYKVPFHIGPLPGVITITASVGVAIEAFAKIDFANQEKGSAYRCAGRSEDCYVSVTEAKSFQEAADACVALGGRLAELSSREEAMNAFLAAKSVTGKAWIGGQMAHAYKDPQCNETFNRDKCLQGAVSSFRWVSNDKEFAVASGEADAVFGGEGAFSGASPPTLKSTLPKGSALLIEASGVVSQATVESTHPFVCHLRAANSAEYLKWSLGGKIGVAAGLGLSACSPTDDPGICIGGSLNFVALSMEPQYANEYYWLSDDKGVFRRTGKTGFVVPWTLTLLEGNVYAAANLVLFSATWDIVAFDGFKLKEDNLVDLQTPFQVDH